MRVESHGMSGAKIFFLGGHPIGQDNTTGLALTGGIEKTINQFLYPHKISLKQCYRSTVFKEKLSYAGSEKRRLKKAVGEKDLHAAIAEVHQELKDVDPNVIVPLDDISLFAVNSKLDLWKSPARKRSWIICYRGSVISWDENPLIKIIPTLGPQALYADALAESYVALDYGRIAKYSQKRELVPDRGIIWIAKTAAQAQTFYERGLRAGCKFLTFDIETFGGLITCISFCLDGNEAISVPLVDPGIPSGEAALIWRVVAKILAGPLPKCNQNIKFDWTILARHGFIVNNVVHDTMLKTGLLYPEFPKGLDFLTSIYTEIPYYKDEGKTYNPKLHTRERLYFYNAKDSLSASVINEAQDAELEEFGMKDLYYNEISPLIAIYKRMDETRIQVDDLAKRSLETKYEIKYDTNLTALRTLINNDKFNPSSPKQVGDLLYSDLKFPKRQKVNIDTGEYSYKTDKDTLDDLAIHWAENNRFGKLGAEIIKRIIFCRKLSRVRQYITTPLYPDNTFGAVSNLAGTNSGRSSSGKSLDERFALDPKTGRIELERIGRSLQTIGKHGFAIDEELFDAPDDKDIAKDLRKMFVPRRGFTFVEGDGSQAEARVVAVLAEDWELLDSFDKKPKIHAKTAALIMGVDVETITKDYPSIPVIGMTYYDLGKRVRHAGNLGMRAFRLAQMTHLSLVDCTKHLKKFHEANPLIQANFHGGVENFLKRNRFLISPHARRWGVFSQLSVDNYKEWYARIPQATVSDHTKFSMRRIIDRLPGVRFLTEQHDGLLAEIPISEVDEYLAVFKEIYERPINFLKCSLSRDIDLKIPCELSVSTTNWMELKEVKI